MKRPRIDWSAVADRWLPPRLRFLFGDNAMLHERDLLKISRSNERRRNSGAN